MFFPLLKMGKTLEKSQQRKYMWTFFPHLTTLNKCTVISCWKVHTCVVLNIVQVYCRHFRKSDLFISLLEMYICDICIFFVSRFLLESGIHERWRNPKGRVSDCCLTPTRLFFSAISWREQINFYEVRFVLDQLA